MSDPIADLIIRLKNASLVDKSEVSMPHSNFKEAILAVMKKNGYIADISSKAIKKKKNLKVKFSPNQFSHIRRLSKPGMRYYVKSKDIPTPLRGLGLVIVSTPKGLLSGKEAKRMKIGGELICEIW